MLNTRMFIKSTLLSFCSFIFLVTACSPNEPNFGILFSANLNGNQDIYRTSSQNFQSIERLTFTPRDPERYIKVTKDGSRILYYVPQPDPSRIQSDSLIPPATYAHTYVLDLKNKMTIDIGKLAGLSPTIPQTWSVNESNVVLYEGRSGKIFTVNPDEKSVLELFLPNPKGSYPNGINYSPDGTQIAYTEDSSFSGVFTLVNDTPFIYDLKTKATRRLGDGSTDCYDPRWSPVEKQILLTCNLSTDGWTFNYHVRLFDTTTGEEAVIKGASDAQCVDPAWSPTGKQFVMVCNTQNGQGIFLVNSDGGGYKEIKISLPVTPKFLQRPTWSPDGRQIIFIAGENQNAENIYITNLDGSSNVAITTQAANYSELSIYSIP